MPFRESGYEEPPPWAMGSFCLTGSLRLEARAAAAGGGCVRVLKHEPAPHHPVTEVDFRAFEVQEALHVHQNRDAVAFHRLVLLAGRFFREVEQVAEARAPAAADADAQARLLRGELLLVNDAPDLF